MSTTDYSGMFIYKDDHLDNILTSEGRLKWDDHDSLFYAEYFIKDHLGNVRTVITTDPNFNFLAQQTDYYPFGQEIPLSGTSDNQLKYNGKELQDEAKLGWYDYGARFYDPQIGRFIGIDPIIENWPSHTPYNYAFSNPVTLIDLWGLQGVNSNAYFNWMVSNPMGAVAEGFRQVFDAAASLFTAQAGVSINQKTNVAEVNAGSSSFSASMNTQSKAEVTFDASGVFDYSGNNQVSLSQLNPFKVETSTSTDRSQNDFCC